MSRIIEKVALCEKHEVNDTKGKKGIFMEHWMDKERILEEEQLSFAFCSGYQQIMNGGGCY